MSSKLDVLGSRRASTRRGPKCCAARAIVFSRLQLSASRPRVESRGPVQEYLSPFNHTLVSSVASRSTAYHPLILILIVRIHIHFNMPARKSNVSAVSAAED